jgi:hypothetical protein
MLEEYRREEKCFRDTLGMVAARYLSWLVSKGAENAPREKNSAIGRFFFGGIWTRSVFSQGSPLSKRDMILPALSLSVVKSPCQRQQVSPFKAAQRL